MADLARVDLSGLAPILSEVRLTVASDVRNPLLGERGAAATYGPQKGANPAHVATLDANLAHYADLLEAASGRAIRDVPGAGAAGGTTAGLLAIADRFAAFEIRPGVEVVMELTGFDEALASCDLVLTGEGRIDEQTGYGKTAMGVAERAANAGKTLHCLWRWRNARGHRGTGNDRHRRRARHRAANDGRRSDAQPVPHRWYAPPSVPRNWYRWREGHRQTDQETAQG